MPLGLTYCAVTALATARSGLSTSSKSPSRVLAVMMIVLLLFLQKQNLANAIYLFGLGTLLSG